MRKIHYLQAFLMSIAMLGMVPCSHAGSDRLIMSMSVQRMDQEDLVHVRFVGPDDAALESNVLGRMEIREQNCSSGNILKIIDDYKIGYAPKSMLVGIYLYPQAWKSKKLCFSIQNLGKIEQGLDPAENNSRLFQLRVAP